jgi:hypothetical protein
MWLYQCFVLLFTLAIVIIIIIITTTTTTITPFLNI